LIDWKFVDNVFPTKCNKIKDLFVFYSNFRIFAVLGTLNKLKKTKLMEITKESQVGAVVRENYKTAQVFKNLGIDFCCGGKKSIEKACSEKNIDLEKADIPNWRRC